MQTVNENLKLLFTRDVLCYVAMDAFGFHQSYSWYWWKRIQISYVIFIWKDACYEYVLQMAFLLPIHRIIELRIFLAHLFSESDRSMID
ncbi:hypothetical protein SFRURICE_018625 [Spodoptera frugiperda]|nr:hypothetical protein SFRURICE_018625 [Spodoptera frugiperda]